jgi:hypothetical protein
VNPEALARAPPLRRLPHTPLRSRRLAPPGRAHTTRITQPRRAGALRAPAPRPSTRPFG